MDLHALVKKLHGMLENCLIHKCIDFIIQPLKKAAEIGIMMSDPLGYCQYCFTALTSCIVDTPESALYACVAGKTLSVTTADFTQFGDPFRHEPLIGSKTLSQLQILEEEFDSWDLAAYISAAKKKFRLNGVHQPFWRDWLLSEPSSFLTPEVLHHFHKMFWDHDTQWCINVVGPAEIDFQFSILHPHVGFHHFKEGISQLKQVVENRLEQAKRIKGISVLFNTESTRQPRYLKG